MVDKARKKNAPLSSLSESESNLLIQFIAASPQAHIILQESGLVLKINAALANLLQCPENKHRGSTFINMLAPSSHQVYFDSYRALFSGNNGNSLHLLLLRHNGSTVPVSLHRLAELSAEDGNRRCIFAVCDSVVEERIAERVATLADQIERRAEEQIRALQREIHERERMEKTFRESQERQALAFWGADMAWWEYNIPAGRFNFSSRIVEILGDAYTSTSIKVDDLYKFIYQDDRTAVVNAFDAHIEGKVPILDVRIRVVSHSCAWKWVLLRGRITEHNENNNPLRMVGIIQDITESKQLEDEHALFFEHATDMFTILNHDGILLHVNPAVEKCLGWAAHEMTGVPAISFTHPDDVTTAMEALASLASNKNLPPVEQRVRTKSRTYRWLSTNVVSLPEHGLSIGIGRDITEKKELDLKILEINQTLEQRVAARSKELEQQKSYLEEAMSIGQMAYWEYDLSTGEFIFDDAVYTLLRTTAAEQGGYRIEASLFQQRFLAASDAPPLAACMANVPNADPRVLRSFEVAVRLGDGTRGYFMVRIRLEKDDLERIVRVFGIAQNVSAHKKLKEDMEQREQLYHNLFETSLSPIFVADSTTGMLIDANRRASEYVGINVEILRTMKFTELHDESSLEIVTSTFDNIRSCDKLEAITAKLRHHSGTYRLVLIHTRAVACGDKNISVAIMTDIEDQKSLIDDIYNRHNLPTS
jgi:PAS domain S-box-containing protein